MKINDEVVEVEGEPKAALKLDFLMENGGASGLRGIG